MEHEHREEINSENEKKTLFVIIFTIITMFAEIIYGYITNSMSLLADGFHMGTHALALGLTFIAYVLIRKFKDSPKFPCGTDKIGTLAAYTSSLFLGLTGFWIIYEAVQRVLSPVSIEFNEAIIVAVIGLLVNTVCILIMENKSHKHDCINEKEDYNFKAAYYHILADALTSVLAILALLTGKYFNIIHFDPIVGMIGGILIIRWSIGLIKHTVKDLINMQ